MNKNLFWGTFIFISIALIGCTTDPGVANKVNAVVVSLTTAENAYVKTCKDVPSLKICVEPIKSQIKVLDQKAYNAVKMAQENSALLSFAVEAVGEFTSASAIR